MLLRFDRNEYIDFTIRRHGTEALVIQFIARCAQGFIRRLSDSAEQRLKGLRQIREDAFVHEHGEGDR
jgi:hypothetical protein